MIASAASYFLGTLLQHGDLAQTVQPLCARLLQDAHDSSPLKKLKFLPNFYEKKAPSWQTGKAPHRKEAHRMQRTSIAIAALCVLATLVLAEDPAPFLVTKTLSNLRKCYIEDLPEDTQARFMYPS